MKVGYPDTINSSAAAASPVKARYASSGEGKGDIEVVKVDIPKKKDSNKPKDSAKESDSPIEYGSTPINMRTPIKNKDIVAENRAAMKAIADKAKKAEAAIRESESSSKNTTEPTKEKNKIGRAIQARKERRAERNPKVAERQKGRAERKELNKKIKTEKARVTTARQERKTSKTTDRLDKVKKKVDTKVTKIKKKK
jgi:hypothetical protein